MRCIFSRSAYLLLAVMLTFSSCETIVLDDLEDSKTESSEKDKGKDKTGETTSLNIITRASDGSELIFPLRLYAFRNDGSLECQSVVVSSEEQMKLSLPKESIFKLVVVSADEKFTLPDNPTLNSVIALQSSNVTGYIDSHPLMMGFIDIRTTSSSSSTCMVQLSHQMTSLMVNLSGLPADCNDVNITVSSPFSAISFGGVGNQQLSTAIIPLNQVNAVNGTAVWTTGKVYLFPTASQNTTFSISFTSAGITHSNSVTYQSVLRAGTPYVLNGNYDDGLFHVDANVVAPQWNDEVNLSFDFSEGHQTIIDATGEIEEHPENASAVHVDEIPIPYTLWNGHIVAAVLDDTGAPLSCETDSATLLLLSYADWDELSSSLNTKYPTEAFDIAKYYVEGDLATGWRIPTEHEATVLYASYWGMLADEATNEVNDSPLEKILSYLSADPLYLVNEKDANVRYLCDEAKKTFAFYNKGVLNAGTTVKTYHLRLVHTVKVTTK